MKLLEAESRLAVRAPEDPPPDPSAGPAPPADARSCPACGATMAPEQDWCLACGAAATGRHGRRPGWRAVMTVVALTLLLVTGAVAASYAALTDDPAPAPSLAQVPATGQPAPAEPDPAATTPAPATPTDTTPELPTVSTPTTSTPAPSPRPLTPAPSTPDDGAAGSHEPPGPGAPSEPELPITLADGAGTVYDPYGRATATGDPGRALDDNRATSWFVDPKDPALIGVGYAIDLGKVRDVKAFELITTTPGFRIEVYASDQTELPPDILDTRWSHIRDISDVGVRDPKKASDVEGQERIALATGTTRYRHVLLWFTATPTEAPRLRITELKLFP